MRARLLTSLILIFFTVLNIKAQSLYSVSSVPPDLKTRAGAVVREMELNVEVKKLNDVVYHLRKVVTVLNENGSREAAIIINYDRTRQVKYVKGLIYNEMGLPVAKINEKNFKDISAASDYSVFEDSRVKYFSPAVSTYPYTIEYEYQIKARQTLSFPEWSPNSSTGVSVEHSQYTFSVAPGFSIRYKALNFSGVPEITTDKSGNKTYKWEIKNLKAYRSEPFSPDPDTYLPSVKIAPVKFYYDGVDGAFSNWKEYGQWSYDKLLKGRDVLSAETVDYVKNLVKGISDPKLKAKKIYEFVQNKTRYVSIQIGIGGFRPMTAEEVDHLNYGDCKALVNYTKALLQAVGIPSYYVVVEAGSSKKSAFPDFASIDQFNHVILCIPFKNDTTWADCTSKTLPFGYLGDFTDDRLAVACTENGGILIHTPVFSSEENLQHRKADFTVNTDGSLNGNIITSFEGLQYENRDMIAGEPYKEQVKKLAEIYSFNNLSVQSYRLKQDKSVNPVTTEALSFNAPEYATINGGRMYIKLNPVNRGTIIKEIIDRFNPVYISHGYEDIDEITYKLPSDYKIDTRPKSFKIEKSFGEFSFDFTVKDNLIRYTRKVILINGSYSKETYPQLVDFFQKIADADEADVTLVKN